MRKKSKKQILKDRTIGEIKKNLPPICEICGKYTQGDLCHILPKSIWCEHYTNPLNLIIMCRYCHNQFDNSVAFRKLQHKIIERVKSFDERAAIRYFKLYDDE